MGHHQLLDKLKNNAASWVKSGSTPGPADREAFERWIRDMYRDAGLDPLVPVIWASSPRLAHGLILACLENWWRGLPPAERQTHPEIFALREGVLDLDSRTVRWLPLYAPISTLDAVAGQSLSPHLLSKVFNSVAGWANDLRAIVENLLGNQGFGSILLHDTSVRALMDEHREVLGLSPSFPGTCEGEPVPLFYRRWSKVGAFPQPTLAAWAFLREQLGWRLSPSRETVFERLSALWTITGLWWPTTRFVLVSEAPAHVHRDASGRFHNADGRALGWGDGWGAYRWHGIDVPEKLILRPNEITREDIENEKNSEVARAISERLGWSVYMERAGVFLVDKWFDPTQCLHYELWDFKKRFDRTPRLLKMESPELQDGTRPTYIEPVHPDLKSCQAARKWQFLKSDLRWPTVQECNQNPALTFEWET